jgi:hypothetical protein
MKLVRSESLNIIKTSLGFGGLKMFKYTSDASYVTCFLIAESSVRKVTRLCSPLTLILKFHFTVSDCFVYKPK